MSKFDFDWVYIHRRIFDDETLSIKTKFTYIVLCKYRQVTKEGKLGYSKCNPSLKRLEKFVESKPNTIKYTHLKKLQENKYITTNKVWGSNDIYEILDIPSTKKGNFVVLPKYIIEDYDYNIYEKMTYFYLIRLKDNDTKTWWGGKKTLSKKVKCNKSKIKEAIDRLLKDRKIEIIGEKNVGKIDKRFNRELTVPIYKVNNWVENILQIANEHTNI